jgi:DNA polymerase kappa
MEPDLEDDLNYNAPDGEDELPTAAEPRASTSGHRPPMFAPSASEILSPSRPSKPRRTGPIDSTRVALSEWQDQVSQNEGGRHIRDDDDDDGCAVPKARSNPAKAPPASTSTTATVSECPLCTRPFTDNDELNAHIDWCLSREAIRSAQVEGDRSERKKPEVDAQNLKEWWKGRSVEGTAVSRKPKRRKLEG